jgi:hypothetical protein
MHYDQEHNKSVWWHTGESELGNYYSGENLLKNII